MAEFSFVMKQEKIERNAAEFVKQAAKYGVEYSVKPFTLDESQVTLKGPHTSKIAVLAGVLRKDE